MAFKLLLALSAFASPVVAYDKFLTMIPNAGNIGQPLGHASSGKTPFGLMFAKADAKWKDVCNQKWPGSDVTVGVALGDCKCTWTSGAAQVTLSSPDPTGAKCKALDTTAPKPDPASAPSGPAPAPGAKPSGPAPAPGAKPSGPAPAPGAKPVSPAPAPEPKPMGNTKGKAVTDNANMAKQSDSSPSIVPAPTPAVSSTHDLCV